MSERFFLKGSNTYDWGMSNRLSRIFNPETGKTVMLAFDHGYFQRPTTGLERVDVTIRPLAPFADALMLTRGILRSIIEPSTTNSIVMRASGGPSILKELSNEHLVIDIEDAVRMNVSAMAVQVFVGGPMETQTVKNMTRLVDMGMRYGIPVLGVTAVGKELTRDARYISLASRMIAELGAASVKTCFVLGFETVSASCPVPIIIAGGKKLPEPDALQMAPYTPTPAHGTEYSLVEVLRPMGANHLAIAVRDLAEIYEKMTAAGETVVTEMVDGRFFFCKDPDGTLLKVKQA
jgi:putative autoinducer-2 (AI-2) aldolase